MSEEVSMAYDEMASVSEKRRQMSSREVLGAINEENMRQMALSMIARGGIQRYVS